VESATNLRIFRSNKKPDRCSDRALLELSPRGFQHPQWNTRPAQGLLAGSNPPLFIDPPRCPHPNHESHAPGKQHHTDCGGVGGCVVVEAAAKLLTQPALAALHSGYGAASVTISQARTEWSRSNPNGQHGVGKSWRSCRQLAFTENPAQAKLERGTLKSRVEG
jgi:hypothetical protein